MNQAGILLSLSAAFAFSACAPQLDAGGPNEDKADIGLEGSDKVDVLFVVDNSGSMQEEQGKLIGHFSSFMDELRSDDGELPDLQIGVVSTDLGVGSAASTLISGCEVSEQGRFQGAPYVAGGDFLFANADGNNLREGYTLAETFTSMASLGTGGCGFEQPLESMRMALQIDNGFVRDDAHLVVVIVSDEDDCSVTNNELFDTSNDSEYGVLSSFRCTKYGVVCSGGSPSDAGSYQDCEGAPTNELYHPEDYANFLNALKPNNSLETFVAVIAGPSDELVVDLQSYGEQGDVAPSLSPSCGSADGVAMPAVRLHHFAELVTPGGVTGNICDANYEDYLVRLATTVRSALE